MNKAVGYFYSEMDFNKIKEENEILKEITKKYSISEKTALRWFQLLKHDEYNHHPAIALILWLLRVQTFLIKLT